MPVLIDGYNLMHAGRVDESRGTFGRAQLCSLLGRWARRSRQAVTVVFDGTAPAEPLGWQLHGCDIEVTYSGPGRSADEMIIERINLSSAPRRLTVVSSDRQVRRAARRRRCRWVDSSSFLAYVTRALQRKPGGQSEPAEKRTGPAAEEVDDWLRTFGYDPELMDEREFGQ
ncbi:MAG: NYN domain-containing protein [Phycisphaerae bacterium]